MRDAVLLICLALCVISVTAAGKNAALLKTSMSNSKATASGYHLEKESLCFRLTGSCTLPKPEFKQGGPSTFMARDDMECTPCPNAHKGDAYHGDTDIGSFIPNSGMIPKLSQCTWDSFEIPDPLKCIPVENNRNMKICGTYQATCYLNEDSKKGCRFPEACQATRVAVQGVSYYLEKAVRVGPFVESVDTCPTSEGGGGGGGGSSCTSPRVICNIDPNVKAAPLYNLNEGTEQEMVPVRSFFLYRGTFTVHASHGLKYTSGSHQFSVAAGEEEPTPINEAAAFERLGNQIHKFDFVAEGAKHPVGY